MKAVKDILERKGIDVPDTIFAILLTGREGDSVINSLDDDKVETAEVKGTIYNPISNKNTFYFDEKNILICIVGPQSKNEALEAFDDFTTVERVDNNVLNNSIKNKKILSVSEMPENPQNRSHSGGFSLNINEAIKNIVREEFYGKNETTEINIPPTPDNRAGHIIEEIVTSDYSLSEEQELGMVGRKSPEQVVSVFPHLMTILSADGFNSYSIDSGNTTASIQSAFDTIAKKSPDKIVNNLGQMESFLQNPKSKTGPEVVTQTLETLVRTNPDKANEFRGTIESLYQSQEIHPRRRAIRIATAITKTDRDQIIAEIVIGGDDFVDTVINDFSETRSLWLKRACCLFLACSELSDTALDRLATFSDEIVRISREGSRKRGAKISPTKQLREYTEVIENVSEKSGDSLNKDIPLTEEYVDRIEISDDDPSAEVLYRLHRAAALLIQKIARERPMSMMNSVGILFDEATSEGEQLKIVRREARETLSILANKNPDGLSEKIAKYDHHCVSMANSEDEDIALIGIKLLGLAKTNRATNVLKQIHQDGTHQYWQQATDALESFNPDVVDKSITPTNLQQQWLEFITELAKKKKRLPTQNEARHHQNAPGEYPWRMFGSWTEVLESLNIDTNRRSTNAPLRSALINDHKQIAADIGRVPTVSEINEHTQYSYYAYKKEFGGIGEARKSAGLNGD